ncbi:MAG: metallophosphoesterase family protein [Verrucomicrobia bacterium]|nr:metallophosphoesterase family protein [Verrucomicrobiota bacterium]
MGTGAREIIPERGYRRARIYHRQPGPVGVPSAGLISMTPTGLKFLYRVATGSWFGAICLCLAVSSLFPSRATSAALLRGPYLQQGTPTTMTVRWRTDLPTASVVLYGQDPDLLFEITGSLQPVTEHIVTVTGLEPDQLYYYSVGSLSETLAQGTETRFRTSPLPGSTRPIRIWAIGDCGTFGLGGENQAGVRDAYYAHPRSHATDVWLALGDNAYFRGEDHEYQLRFFNVYHRIMRNTVLWSTLGNHETYSQLNRGVLPYFDMFTFPTRAEAGGVASGTENYYSFDYGNVHFICVDSEIANRRNPAAMLQWLRSDLEANTADWTIAFWHTPPYSMGSHHSDWESALAWMREEVVPILEAHGVDLVLSGHSHIYERSYLLHGHYEDSTTLTSEMILDRGDGRPGGSGAYHKLTSGPRANKGAVYVVAGSSGWATFRTGFHPAMYYDALTRGSLVLDVNGLELKAQFLTEQGTIDDHFTIRKLEGPAFPLLVRSITLGAGGVAMWFWSEPGKSYQVEATSSLESPAQWEPIGEPIVAQQDRTQWTHRAANPSQQLFFRVLEVQ